MQIINYFNAKKGGLTAAFFSRHKIRNLAIALSVLTAVIDTSAHAESLTDKAMNQAQQANLAQHPVWASLLHVSENNTNIRSKKFLLSAERFSLENEMAATLNLLYSGNTEQVCRFPARYLWLREHLNLPELPLSQCEDYQEFLQRAPIDRIDLAFASENLAQPSSMMGHVFLKLSGRNQNDQELEHAISFFTDAASINLPKLFYDTMVVGKQGYFSLSPYTEKLALYLSEEQRSLWEYELNLSPSHKALIQAHLIELKQVDLVYFFQKYNCATVIDFILALAHQKQMPYSGFWLTPKDVVKRAHAAGIIKSSRVISPNRWLIRALSAQLSTTEVQQVAHHVDQQREPEVTSSNEQSSFLKLKLAQALNSYRAETKQIDESTSARYGQKLNAVVEQKFPTHQIESIDSKNPIDNPQDSQVSLGYVRKNGANYLRLNVTPASHHLEDDNRFYFSESELLLFDLAVLKSLDNRSLKLDTFTLYGMRSLIPYDPLSGGISGSFELGVGPQLDAGMQERRVAYISGALGYTFRYGRDIDMFALMGGGLSSRDHKPNFYLKPELGLVMREVFDMKTYLSAVWHANVSGDASKYWTYRLVQSKYFDKQNWSLHLRLEWMRHRAMMNRSFELSGKWLF